VEELGMKKWAVLSLIFILFIAFYLYPKIKYTYFYSGELVVVKELPKVYHKDKCELIKGKSIVYSLSNPVEALDKSLRQCNSCNPPGPTKEQFDKFSEQKKKEEEYKTKKDKLDNLIKEKSNTGLKFYTPDEWESRSNKGVFQLHNENELKAIEEIKKDPQYKEFEEILKEPVYQTK
jgi:hypothetical protein